MYHRIAVIVLVLLALDNHLHAAPAVIRVHPPSHSPAPAPTPAPQLQPPELSLKHGTTPGSLHPQECGDRCTMRCSRTQYRKPCLFFCNKCCAKCLCVPLGTYGNKQTCPCYNEWKTKRGGPKCP